MSTTTCLASPHLTLGALSESPSFCHIRKLHPLSGGLSRLLGRATPTSSAHLRLDQGAPVRQPRARRSPAARKSQVTDIVGAPFVTQAKRALHFCGGPSFSVRAGQATCSFGRPVGAGGAWW